MNLKLMNFEKFQISKESQKNIKGATTGHIVKITITYDGCSCGANNPNNWEYGQTTPGPHFLPCRGEEPVYHFIVID